ncbi:hypothetical protein P692DRAFT_20882205 [Suillus brevipes Sb2]|nr:hypothetical protein P692DRAFT_20882205 [Suillus brevipes Sb2]
MRLPRPSSGISFIILVLLMVSCGAVRCSWERATDFRGLDRHRTTCKYYQKESKLAAEKRRDRARESVSQNLRPQPTAGGITCLAPIRSVKIRSKTIAYCESTGRPPLEPVNQAIDNTARTSASTFTFQDSDVTMEDTTEQYHGNSVDSGQHHSSRAFKQVPRSFDDFLPTGEDVNFSDSTGNGSSTLPDIQNPPHVLCDWTLSKIS